jgi:hypothetical protein
MVLFYAIVKQNRNITRHRRKGKLMTASRPRRRPPKVDTDRALAKRSCARHLKDLHRFHQRAPADVPVNERGVPKFVPPIIEQSYCTSPAALCVELAEVAVRAHSVDSAELMKLAELGAELIELEAELAELFK